MRLNTNNIKERIKGTFIEALKIQFIEDDNDNELLASMNISTDLLQTSGVLHGGATISLAETVSGVASNIVCAEDEQSFGIQISANHISHGQLDDNIIAKATAIHLGRTTHLWNVDVYSENTGNLISSVQVTNIIVKRK